MIKKHKNIIIISLLLITGIILIILGSINQDTGKSDTDVFSLEEYTTKLENKIEDFLLSVDGVTKVRVIVTLDTSCEHIYTQNTSSYNFLLSENSDADYPVQMTEIYPTVRGVAISCTHGDNDEMKIKITNLISAYLGISSNRIEIVGIK